MNRISTNSRVSTEAWQFDNHTNKDENRWSYLHFGESWRDARLFGTVKGATGHKWIVRWDVDGSETSILTSKLFLEHKEPESIADSGTDNSSELEFTDSAGSDLDYEPDVSRKRRELLDKSLEREAFGDETLPLDSERICTDIIADGEEVYLCLESKIKVFKAVFSNKGGTVHGREMGKDEGRFFIVKIMKDCSEWEDFDGDVHCVGAAIMWSMQRTLKFLPTEIEEFGTQAREPQVLANRKRKRDPSNWIRNSKKRALNRGLRKYGSKNADAEGFPSHKPGKSCKCRLKCNEKFSETSRKAINENFWSLGNSNLQRAFIVKFVTSHIKQRTRIRAETKSGTRRSKSNMRHYNFLHYETGETIRICQLFFLSTLNISKKRVETAINKISETGCIIPDNRGQAGSHNAVTEKRELPIINHIQQFLTVESHYVRRDSSWQYLPVDLSVKEMHRMYLEWCNNNGVHSQESYDFYHRIFKTRFNLKFHRPKKDVCDLCTSFENAPVDARGAEYSIEYAKHAEEKKMARLFKSSMKDLGDSSTEHVVASFDFQKTLLCPYGQASSFYYSQRLRNYNFTITNINSMETACFLWNETQAKKGSCEVATALFRYLESLSELGKKGVHLFCDRCGGQNNNRIVVVMLLHASSIFNFDEITLNFMVTGHSQNENDNAHSVIETATRGKTIFTTQQWEMAIKMAFKKHTPAVDVLNHRSIYDFKAASTFPHFSSIWRNKSIIDKGKNTGEKIYWSKVMQMKFKRGTAGTVFFKYSYGETDFQEVKLFNAKPSTRLSVDNITNIALPCLYNEQPGISKDKYKDLSKLCAKNLIPPHVHSFYKNLTIAKDDADLPQ